MALRLRSNPHAPSVAPKRKPKLQPKPKTRSREATAVAATAAEFGPIDRPAVRRKRDARPHTKREPEDPDDVDEDALLMRPGYDRPNLQRFLTRRIVHDSRALRVLSREDAPAVSLPRSSAPHEDAEQAPRRSKKRRRR